MLIDLLNALGGYFYDVFVVRLDWWLALGFLAHPELGREYPGGAVANWRSRHRLVTATPNRFQFCR